MVFSKAPYVCAWCGSEWLGHGMLACIYSELPYLCSTGAERVKAAAVYSTGAERVKVAAVYWC